MLGLGMTKLGSFYSCDIMWLFDFVGSLLTGVLVFVLLMFFYIFSNKYYFKSLKALFVEGECFCSILPCIILVVQMIPSFYFLYSWADVPKFLDPLCVKVTGHQWYWEYEYEKWGYWMRFDSYMVPVSDLGLGDLRLLEVSEHLILPQSVLVRFAVSSADVIHSWAVPAFCFKVDAIPGVMNVFYYVFDSVGLFYGQCSEICGASHSFMPIVIEVVPDAIFNDWVEDRKHKYDIATRLGDWYKMNGVSSFS